MHHFSMFAHSFIIASLLCLTALYYLDVQKPWRVQVRQWQVSDAIPQSKSFWHTWSARRS
jgi:hypothetical protein